MIVRLLTTATLVLLGSVISVAADVDFAADVLPVLQRSCFECHGREKSAGGLRLDSAAALQQGGDSGAVVIAGKPGESELLRRISLPKTDSEVMPNRGEVLSPLEVAKIREWIAAGAVWPAGAKSAPHWAYVPPQQKPVPKTEHPVDHFVRQRLVQAKLNPSPGASPAVIARRLYLDVIGLPPSPAQVSAFEMAAKRDVNSAVEQLVDDLLQSRQYGEKWARPWLDAARYADSHGFQRDDLRELWPYRDWVIRALNADMPFDQFTLEQLAGDLLPNATESQRIASGFNRCAPCNVEAGTDPEENRVNQVFDRVNTLGAVWLGTTFECAQCHDHKYDPITQRDYYGLFAFFNQTAIEAERANPKVPGSIRFVGPYLDLQDPELDERRHSLTTEIAKLKEQLAKLPATAKATTPAAEADTGEALIPVDFDSAGDAGHKILDDGSILLVGDPPATDVYTITVHTKLKNITGFKLEALTDPSLPGMGPGRGDPQRTNFVLHEFSVAAAPLEKTEKTEAVKLTDAHASFSQDKWDVAGAIDGRPNTGWAIAPRFSKPHWATFRTTAPLGFEQGTVLIFKLVQEFGQARTLGRLRLSTLTGEGKAVVQQEPAIVSPGKRSLETQLATLENRLKAMKAPRTLVMQQVAQPRQTKLFMRGDFRTPGDSLEPATPAILSSANAKQPDRIALARWLCHENNPLTARVAVNRIWQEVFGEGLVTTPEDFGIKGQRPTHPELLDWLAVEFRQQGWSQKDLLKTILMSETYRQSSRITAELRELDPQNRLLARGPSYRLSAEGIRDNALAIAGLIDLKQFGPPIYPPQPAGLWNKVGGEKYEYTVSAGSEQHRRGIYVVLKRMSPNPSLTTFDATARLSCRVKRLRSNTPLQALTLLNDPVYVEAARAFAQRVVREQPAGSVDARLTYAFQLAVARTPVEGELAVLRKLFEAERMAENEEAAWFAVASALLNLDETITKG
ncbi:PSD1 and planctomycete cytochrome C domain-containing protein [Anatilimnocola sp. NA78]|uniref:PSD1 and planctomycete cytochrome C domain-containing protein n=1 Tax=Anatilimnocola sp. NA78 TaxID=3415683 RepID=UPI003CE59091